MPESPLDKRGLIEVRVCIPKDLFARFEAIVKGEKAFNAACRRAGQDVKDRISRSALATDAIERFVLSYEKKREKKGPRVLPTPRPRGRPKKQPD